MYSKFNKINEIETDNPYAPPKSEKLIKQYSNEIFKLYNHKQLRKLYYRSSNINAIVVLTIIVISFSSLVVVSLPKERLDYTNGELFVFFSILAFCLVTCFGLYKRTSWGRVLGIILCVLIFFYIPLNPFIGLLGMLIGVMGLFAFFKAPELFGKDRITHKLLRAEYKYRTSF